MNIILINIDSLRRDKVGVYTNNKDSLTPNIDNLAKNGTILSQHMTILNGSTPSQISMFNGCYPTTHGVHENGYELPNKFKTIAEYLKNEGYTTCAAVSSQSLGSAYNFNKGFDYFFDNSKYDKIMRFLRKIRINKRYDLRKIIRHLKLFNVFSRSYDKTNKDVLNWIDKHNKEKFFLFIHYIDLHGKTTGIIDDKKEFKLINYDKNVKIIDKAVNELIDKLKQFDIFNDSLFIITADHGEDLEGDVGKIGHGKNITENEFRIPCIIHKQGLIPKNIVNNLTRSIDILPTILDLIGTNTTNPLDGVSFKKSIFNNKDVIEEVFLESYPLFGDIKGIRTKNWLYILHNKNEEKLYDIIKDNELKNDLVKDNKKLCLKFKIKVKNHFSIKYEPGERDEYTKEMLAELGYVKNIHK